MILITGRASVIRRHSGARKSAGQHAGFARECISDRQDIIFNEEASFQHTI